MAYRILAINPGSTSTKIGVFQDETEVWSKNLLHSAEELSLFRVIQEQYPFRLQRIQTECLGAGLSLREFDAFVARGGLLRPLAGGTYKVTEAMLRDLAENRYGAHASNLGASLAYNLGLEAGKASFIVDPVVVDELEPVARVTGLPEIEKRSIFHALNQKAIARRLAKSINRSYEDLNLVVAHLGGGISVGCHKKGRVVEVNNALNGDGPFSPERAGAIQAGQFAELILSREYSRETVERMLAGRGGMVAHLGVNDAREVERRIREGDSQAALVYEAMIYQVARAIAAAAVPAEGRIDYIVLTGGMAHSKYITDKIARYVAFIAPIRIFAGEDELSALSEGALRVLRGEEPYKEY